MKKRPSVRGYTVAQVRQAALYRSVGAIGCRLCGRRSIGEQHYEDCLLKKRPRRFV